MQRDTVVELLSLGLFLTTYAVWIGAVIWLSDSALGLAVMIAAVAIAFHASLQHEAIHGHPFRATLANTLLACPPLTLTIPYLRYRDTHLLHHQDSELTDPYDDPESNYFDPDDWDALPRFAKTVFQVNNTLAGRLTIGPLVGTFSFLNAERKAFLTDPNVRTGWLWHLPAAAVVLSVVVLSPMPFWAYLLAVYVALALLRIRTFLEHQAHEFSRARSVIIEDRGPLAFLFLNNNLHAVHHAHPNVAWYDLPKLYAGNRERFLAMNEGYAFRSYGDIFRRYLFRRKDPLAHPLRGKG